MTRHPSVTVDQTHLKQPFILWIGGIWAIKKPLQVIDIARNIPDLDFIVVGPAKDRALLEQFLRLKTANVHYLGPASSDERTALIRKCSAGLSTSARETFGWVPFEFLQEGKPIICRRLKSFRELYGTLPIYADSTDEFVHRIRQLQANRFRTSINLKKIQAFKEKYNLATAADATMRKLSVKRFTILTRDTDPVSDYIAGFLLVDWQLWRSMFDRRTDMQIISNGSKFAIRFGLREYTALIPNAIMILKREAERLEVTSNFGAAIFRRILRLTIYVCEPMCYLYTMTRLRAFRNLVLADGYPQITAAILAKLIFRSRTACLLHDDDFYRDIWDATLPLVWRIFNKTLAWGLARYVDNILAVSTTLRDEILLFYPKPERVSLLWS